MSGHLEAQEHSLASGKRSSEAMGWAQPQFSRQQVNAAGRVLIRPVQFMDPAFALEYEDALSVLNNWRASHSYPLNTFQVNLRNAARGADPHAVVAQRIKRLSSIQFKLRRFPDMKLSQMQDIGGCRAVVGTVSGARSLYQYYRDSSRIKHELSALDNYISTPRKSGYRGIHLIYRYYSDKSAKSVYNGLKIEMQLRSRYQHAWATAVETVGAFVGQALKSSMGETQWLRFFALMGTEIALRERCPPVPDTSTNRKELREELRSYAAELDVAARLQGYNHALQALGEGRVEKNARFYLLQLNPAESVIYVRGFSLHELEEASRAYIEAEKAVREKEGMDAVLVSVESLSSLRRAYPNYFADTRVFLALLEQALTGETRRVSP